MPPPRPTIASPTSMISASTAFTSINSIPLPQSSRQIIPPIGRPRPDPVRASCVSTPTVSGLIASTSSASTIDLLNWHPRTGELTLVQKTELLPRDFHGVSSAAEIIFDSKGQYAYASNRGDNFLMGFAIDQSNGKLTFPRRSSCGGKTPRHIALDPTERWILVANQDSNLIAVFGRDPKTGQLQTSGPTAPIQSPQCLLFV